MYANKHTGQHGSALVISLLVLLVMTMIGTMFMVQTKTETQIAGHDMRHTQALYNAEAGSAEVLARMSRATHPNFIGQPTADPVEPGWGRYVVLTGGNSSNDPAYAVTESDGLDNDSDLETDEDGEHYPEVLSEQDSVQIAYPWVKLHYKLNPAGDPILFGDHDNNPSTPSEPNLVNGLPILVVTSSGSQGSAARTLEVEAVKHPFTTVNSAVYLETDDAKFNGTQFLVSGRDWDPDTGLPIIGNPEVPGIVTTADPAEIIDELSGSQLNNVEGAGAEPSVASSTSDLDLAAMAQEYGAMAETTLPGGTYSNDTWGGVDDYTVLRCTGDMHTSGQCVGGGLLIVDGDLDVSGQFLWYGMVIVLGDIRFTGGGAGIHIYGTVLGNGLDQQTVGGNADILYSSIAIARLTTEMMPYVVASWHEL
jgi:hypothetical protein